MEKKQYERPATEVMDIEAEDMMIQASINAVKSDDGFHYGGGDNVPNRIRSHGRNVWSNGWEV